MRYTGGRHRVQILHGCPCAAASHLIPRSSGRKSPTSWYLVGLLLCLEPGVRRITSTASSFAAVPERVNLSSENRPLLSVNLPCTWWCTWCRRYIESGRFHTYISDGHKLARSGPDVGFPLSTRVFARCTWCTCTLGQTYACACAYARVIQQLSVDGQGDTPNQWRAVGWAVDGGLSM